MLHSLIQIQALKQYNISIINLFNFKVIKKRNVNVDFVILKIMHSKFLNLHLSYSLCHMVLKFLDCLKVSIAITMVNQNSLFYFKSMPSILKANKLQPQLKKQKYLKLQHLQSEPQITLPLMYFAMMEDYKYEMNRVRTEIYQLRMPQATIYSRMFMYTIIFIIKNYASSATM